MNTTDNRQRTKLRIPHRLVLLHDQHMTVTMERYHHCVVDVRIIDRVQDGDAYSREILLLKQGTETVVQFGIVRFDLQYVTPAVRDEILKGETPFRISRSSRWSSTPACAT